MGHFCYSGARIGLPAHLSPSFLICFPDGIPAHAAFPQSPTSTILSGFFELKYEGFRSFYFAYNFIKIHRTLRMSPALAAGVTDRLWSVEDLVALWEAFEQRSAERAP